MLGTQIQKLEKDLWDAADQLRANSKLTASEYSMPVLGLIFLRHADNRFEAVKTEIESNRPVHPGRGVLPASKSDFLSRNVLYLPDESRFEYLASLPEEEDIAQKLNKAMTLIEEENDKLKGVLPKDYQKLSGIVLRELIRTFTNDEMKKLKGDVFGRIYEYFIGSFAMSGAQEGGEFFTPSALVQMIVNVIEPDHGIVLDPAVGSAGMFVQTGHFIEQEGLQPEVQVRFFGQEKTEVNTRLAKMNMAVHGLEGNIQEANTFYEDRFELVGKCDYVMANPPFNVDGVKKDNGFVMSDPRLPFGLPKNDNANYLWIQYFYSYLNDTGRAGFVMAASASDAGHSEKEIRKLLVESGSVDVMISIGTNFFYTVTLPCTLWFFDRAKAKDETRSQQTLMIDARPIFRVVTRKINDFSPEQLRNITSIVHLYRGEKGKFFETIAHYIAEVDGGLNAIIPAAERWFDSLSDTAESLKSVALVIDEITEPLNSLQLDEVKISFNALQEDLIIARSPDKEPDNEPDFLTLAGLRQKALTALNEKIQATKPWIEETVKSVDSLFVETKNAVKSGGFTAKSLPAWNLKLFKGKLDQLKSCKDDLVGAIDRVSYFLEQIEWLLTRFPEGVYCDVPGLCKIASRDEIAGNDYSLTPGRYVGISTTETDDENFQERIKEIYDTLAILEKESNELSNSVLRSLRSIIV